MEDTGTLFNVSRISDLKLDASKQNRKLKVVLPYSRLKLQLRRNPQQMSQVSLVIKIKRKIHS